MRFPSVNTIPTSLIRAPNHGESPVVSRSRNAKRALARSNIMGDSKPKRLFPPDGFQSDHFGTKSHRRAHTPSTFVLHHRSCLSARQFRSVLNQRFQEAAQPSFYQMYYGAAGPVNSQQDSARGQPVPG